MSKIDTNTHKEGHRLPPKNVPFNEITKDLIATTVTGTKKIKQISIVLSILSIIGLMMFFGMYLGYTFIPSSHFIQLMWGLIFCYIVSLYSYIKLKK